MFVLEIKQITLAYAGLVAAISKTRDRLTRCELIAIGASAGGFPALKELLTDIDSDFPAMVVVLHLDPRHKSQVASLLARKTGKSIKEANHDESIVPGTIYIGPPDEHLLVSQGKIQLAHSRPVLFARPSSI